VQLDPHYFGEGIALWNDLIIQLTWKEQTALVYDKQTLARVGQFRYQGEGWGLTHDGRHLIMSDGTSTLRFLDPKTFAVARELAVRSNGRRVWRLNELEYVRGEIWANVWYQDYIIRISPASGDVVGRIDLQPLYPAHLRRTRDDVLNGIAYDAEHDRLLVTGKNWPKLYEIRVAQR
jgi:glutamine cyclotransferase